MEEHRTLAVDHSAEIGGAQLSLLHMAKTLRWDVLLLCPGALSPLLDNNSVQVAYARSDLGPATSVRTKLGARTVIGLLRDSFLLRRAVLKALRQGTYSVVVINSLRAMLLLVGIRHQTRNVRYICMVRDALQPPYLSRARSLFSQVIVRYGAHRTIANSAWTARTLFNSPDISVVYPFVDVDFFNRPPSNEGHRLEWKNKPLRVVCLGRLAYWKGQHVAVEACKILATRGVEVRLSIAGGSWFGEDKYEDQLRELTSLGSPVAVDFLGHVVDVVDLIDRSDVVLHTSIYPEPFGQVIVQAMARSRIVVASDAGGPVEIVESGVTGFLTTPGSSTDLARVLEKVALHEVGEDELDRMRLQATDRARLRFHPHLQAEKLASIVRDEGRIASQMRRS